MDNKFIDDTLYLHYFGTKVLNVWRSTNWDKLSDRLRNKFESFRNEIFKFSGSRKELEKLINERLKELYKVAYEEDKSEDEGSAVRELHKQTIAYFKERNIELNIIPLPPPRVKVIDGLSGKSLLDAEVVGEGPFLIVKRDGYKDFIGPADGGVVKLSPLPVDFLVKVILTDEFGDLGPASGAVVVAKPISYVGRTEEALADEHGTVKLRLFFDQEYEVKASYGDSVCGKHVTISKFYEEIELKIQTREYCRLRVNVVPRVTSLSDFMSSVRRPELFITLYDLEGNFLAKGYTGEEISLARPLKPCSKVIVNVYPIDSGDQYLEEWHKTLKDYFMSEVEHPTISVERQEINIRVPFPSQTPRQSLNKQERLSVRFSKLPVFRDIERFVKMFSYKGKKPEITDKSFCDYLEWGDERKAMAIFGKDYDGRVLKLYRHQYDALMRLEEAGSKPLCLILASGMASGKTEVAVLYLLKLFKRTNFGPGGHALVVYPTRELLRNQYSRWKMYFDGAYDLGYLPVHVEVAMLYGELSSVRKEREMGKLRRAPCVVLTTASMLFSWANRLDKELGVIPSIIVLDEVHYYSAFDLTLIIELLRFILRTYGGCSKVLMFSATIGKREEFARNVEECLPNVIDIAGESLQGPETIYSVDLSSMEEKEQEAIINKILKQYSERGFSDKTIIFAKDRNEAESLFRKEELKTFRRMSCLHLGDMDMYERKISARYFSAGERKVIVSVKTLEVGIDVGDASRIIHLKLPPTLNEFMQREGRIGRRGQECESIVILRDKGDTKRFEEWIEKLATSRQHPDTSELLSKLVFNSGCEVAQQIRHKYEASRKFPEYIIKFKEFKYRCKVYGGLTSFFVKSNNKSAILEGKHRSREKRIWVKDVIFRYLPYSIRQVLGKRCIVKDIVFPQTKGEKPTIVIEDLERSNLISHDLKGAVHMTTCSVDVNIHPLPSLSQYKTIIVEYDPRAVNYVERRVGKIYDEKSGCHLEVPVYHVIGKFPVRDGIRAKLRKRSWDFTRGFEITINVPSEIADALRPFLHGKDLESVQSLLKVTLDEYVHLAVHAILNQVVRKAGWSPREIDHFIKSIVNVDEETKQKLKELIEEPVNDDVKCNRLIESLLPRLSMTVVIGNKADLLKGFNWDDVQIEELERLETADLEAELIYPWCPVKPDLLRHNLADPNNKDRKLIAKLAGLILEKVKEVASGVKGW